MTKRFCAVLDTNIYVAAFFSRNVSSPNKELMQRWRNGEFQVIACEFLKQEIVEKFLARKISPTRLRELLIDLDRLARLIVVGDDEIPSLIPADPDDDVIIACAVKAKADYLVTYDPHFDVLGGEYGGVRIVKALPFLWAVRGDRPPGD
ncbi:MAG TPA: putative toxin-antitoxin system toxin component, PIN family [Caldilineae bacterium]|nr:putative toxin-antitoxin system toxin component, PIN family [Caldilineae bacterium]